MFCNQCEESIKGGCNTVGVCGKNENISSLQDTIIYALKGIAAYGYHAKELGYKDEEGSDKKRDDIIYWQKKLRTKQK